MNSIQRLVIFAFCTSIFAQSPVPLAYKIDTVVGANPLLEGVSAREEYISYPGSITSDSKGNIFYVDAGRAVIRKIAPSGTITTYVGNGTSGFSGDGGPATRAQINGDANLAVDSSDNLYLADTYNLRVRKVTADGLINTIAGNGLLGFSGDGGPARAARFGLFGNVVVDDRGNVYVASLDYRIRRIAVDGTVQTVVGTGTGGFSGDGGPASQARLGFGAQVAAADRDGSLYITDNFRIRKVSPDGNITTIAGTGVPGFNGEGDGGPALAAQLGPIDYIAVDGKGGLYFAEEFANRVRRIRPDGIIETIAGTGEAGYSGDGGPATAAKLNYPGEVALGADGALYIPEVFNHVIRRVAPDGTITTYAGRDRYAGDGGPASAAILNDPLGVALDNRGNLYFSENFGKRIRRVDAAGMVTTSAAALTSPGTLATDGSNNLFFVDGDTVRRATPEGIVTTLVSSGLAGSPQGLATDKAGNLFIADTGNNVIRKVASDGTTQIFAGTGSRGFAGDGGPATAAKFNGPEGLAFDNAGNLYIADHNNLRVRRIAPSGVITTIAGNGTLAYLDNGWPDPRGDGGPAVLAQLFGPERVAVDASGSIFIGEHGNVFYFGNRIRRVTPDGLIDTVAGTGDYGFSGDGGLARNAQLHWVSQLAADGSGKIYFADRLNYRVRVLTPLYGSLTAPK